MPSSKRGECAVHRQALKSTTSRGNRRVVDVRLFLLSRSQNQFSVHFRGWILRIQHHFLREGGETHELNANDVSPAGHSRKFKFAFEIRRRGVFFSRQCVRRGNRHARQRGLGAARRSLYFISRGGGGSRRGRRRRRSRRRLGILRTQPRRKKNCDCDR